LNSTHTLYPTISKYLSSIRYPQIAFKNLDPILVAGKPVEKAANSQGFKDLWTAAGGFACVFKYQTFNPNKLWAVRCFLQSTSSVASHYSKVSNRLKNVSCSSYFVECDFQAQGIRVDGNLYPIVKMEWAEGKDLRTFIRDNLNNKSKLDLLAQAWINLSKDLIQAGIAHGDLQHGNILVDDSNGVNLKLIDYDSLYFSVDGNSIDDEIKGIPDYQHPLRSALTKQSIEIDFFPQLVIYLSIIAIAENPQLWNTYNLDNTERLLFSTVDFQNPDTAQVFNTLSQLSSNVSRLADELKKLCKLTDFSKIPSLDAVLTPPTTTWNPGGTTTTTSTSQPQNPQPQTWNPAGTTTTTSQPQTQNPPPQTWNPTGTTTTTSQPQTPQPQTWNPTGTTTTTSQPQTQNPPPQTWNPTGATTTTSQPQNPPPQTWNPTGSSSNTSQPMNISPTLVTSHFWVKAIAVVSTVVATAFGGFSYYQYQQLNQIKKQIDRIKLENKLLFPKEDKSSKPIDIQELINVFKGEKSLLYLELEKVMENLKKNESSFKEDINQLQSRVNEIDDKNRSLQKENDSLQSRVNELTKYTYVKFYNKTESKTISAALAFWNGEGLRSKGWYVVSPGEFKEVSLGQNYRGNVYVYGEYNRGSSYWGSGDSSFCIDRSNSFDIPNSDKSSCSSSNLKRVTMSKFYVSPGTNEWPFKD